MKGVKSFAQILKKEFEIPHVKVFNSWFVHIFEIISKRLLGLSINLEYTRTFIYNLEVGNLF